MECDLRFVLETAGQVGSLHEPPKGGGGVACRKQSQPGRQKSSSTLANDETGTETGLL